MIINLFVSVYFYVFFSIATLINFIFAIFVFFLPFLKSIFHYILSQTGKTLLFLSGSQIEVLNSYPGNKDESYLIISNHQSLFDILVMYTVLPKIQYKWIIKKSLFYIPFFGFILWSVGYINLDRENRYRAFKAIQKAIQYMTHRYSIVIFPEGTRSLTDTINEFKSGSIVMAYHSGAKILPVLIKNTLFIKSKKSLIIRPLKIKVKFLEPIDTKDKPKNQQKEILQGIHKQMLTEYKRIE